eukprot:TRINITY_DN61259_c0_g1_i1.p1 TRINITY_DN61259_c0_g1~~TRINITY_DN61259_c0_g1_i1.p1  ORF type:complete len:139 (+),score=12.05 TRINITY_DN61259_c0_g1_i1:33-419(+)
MMPFLSAVAAGAINVPENGCVVLGKAPDGCDAERAYFTTISECAAAFPRSFPKWVHLFSTLRQNKDLSRAVCLDLLWDAHDETIQEVMPMAKPKLANLPKREAAYAEGWSYLVRFLAGVKKDTGYTET